MSKIDEYNEIKFKNSNAIKQLHLTQRRTEDGKSNNDSNDKGRCKFYDHQIWDSDMKIYIHAAYGYYGSSSAYSVRGDVVKKYLLKAINQYERTIVDKAIELLKYDIEKARLEAENEAKEVLQVVNNN